MNEYDYEGDFEVFKRKLRAAGIDDQEHRIENYAGLTYRQLNGLVEMWIAQVQRKKEGVALSDVQ